MQPREHDVQAVGQLLELVSGAQVGTHVGVAFGHALRHVPELVDRSKDELASDDVEQENRQNAGQQTGGNEDDAIDGDVAAHVFDRQGHDDQAGQFVFGISSGGFSFAVTFEAALGDPHGVCIIEGASLGVGLPEELACWIGRQAVKGAFDEGRVFAPVAGRRGAAVVVRHGYECRRDAADFGDRAGFRAVAAHAAAPADRF